ncbi:MAG: membrane-bound lytic murein transglycosylase MltF [Halieaceae bacterium]|jgi:membrane-bound lytic murein transglycosylase MltF
MQSLRRFTFFILLTTALIACGDTEAPTVRAAIESPAAAVANSADKYPAEVTEELQREAQEPPPARDDLKFVTAWTGDLDGMEERRIVRILTVYSPGHYFIDGADEKGIVAELAGRFEDALNKKFNRGHLRIHVVVLPIARDQLIPALLAGKGDIVAASLSITANRQQLVDFSTPISKPLSEILVTGPSAADLSGKSDLAGKTVYVRQSSSYMQSVEKLNEQLVAEGKAPVKIELVSELLEDDDLIEMVDGGLMPWAIVDDYKVQTWEGVFNSLKPRNDITFREGGRIAWAFRKDSPQLTAAVNEFVKANRQGTLMGNILINRYVRDFDWAANALNEEDYGRLKKLEGIFKKYGEKYEIEYLMAAAQGYQESRLDQSVRSHAGAVGVMQLLPTTANDPKVGIPNIDEVDANIEAGIKYMAYLRSRYFDDPEIDLTNQFLLALGAYNAGPARMISLRRKATQQGYDPNIWFDNVEIIAAQDIGRETVQYVANIFKYYQAYRMSIARTLEREEAREEVGM